MSKFNAWRSNGPPAVNSWLAVLIVNSGTQNFCVPSEVFSYDQVTSVSCLGFEFAEKVNLQQFVEFRTSSVLPNHLFSNLQLHFQFAFKASSYQLFHFFVYSCLSLTLSDLTVTIFSHLPLFISE